MAAPTKKDLLDALDFALSTYVLGVMSPALVPPKEWERLARKGGVTEEAAATAPLRADTLRVAQMMLDPAKRGPLAELQRESLKRALLDEAHEMILTYTVATQQFPKYRAEPWWAFARVARLAMQVRSGGVLREWPRDLAAEGVTSLAWRGRRVSDADVGMLFRLSHAEALALFRDHVEFARERIA